jgi:3-deoxy-7-phosphoheptulonate synthase
MKPGASEKQIQHVVSLVREYGLKDNVIRGTDRTVIACIGDKRLVDKGAIENAPMVERIVPILAPYKLASTEVQKTRTQVKVGPAGFPIGGRKIGVIAGPCSVEGRDKLLRVAEMVPGASAFAAGRTSRGPLPTASRAWAWRVSRCLPRPARRRVWRSSPR